MKICLLPSDFDGPGCYRLLFPARELRTQYGWEALVAPYEMKDGKPEIKLGFEPLTPDADVYVVQNRAGAWLADWGVKLLQECGKIVVADTDDYYLGTDPRNPGWQNLHRYSAEHYDKKTGRLVAKTRNPNNVDNIHRVYAQADRLTVSTPFLAEKYSRYNPNVTVLPNYLDWLMWDSVEPQYEVERPRVRVGWMGDVKWGRESDIRVLQGVIQPFLERHPEVEFVAAGSPEVHDMLGVPAGQRVTVEGIPFHKMRLPEITAVMDIGLVPLADTNFNRGKSALKGMEYAACGVPCIASPLASYREWVDEGENGFLAKRAHDWVRSLELLVTDDDLRREMGRKARLKASEHTIQEHAHLWKRFYEDASPSVPVGQRVARAGIMLGAVQKPKEFAGLIGAVRDLRPRVVLEIGSAAGGSFFAWCKVSASDALLISVDLPGGKFGGTPTDPRRLLAFRRGGQDVKILLRDSHSDDTHDLVEQVLDGREVDFLFIDGDHTYEGVKRDFELYSPLVRDGGLVGFHDIVFHPAHPDCKVDEFWNEIKGGYDHREFVEQNNYGNPRWGGIGTLVYRRAGVRSEPSRQRDPQAAVRAA